MLSLLGLQRILLIGLAAIADQAPPALPVDAGASLQQVSPATVPVASVPAAAAPSHSRADALAAASGVVLGTAIALPLFHLRPLNGFLLNEGLTVAAPTPLFAVDPLNAWQVNGLTWASFGAFFTASLFHGWAAGPLQGTALTLSLHEAIWAPYALYRDVRLADRAQGPDDPLEARTAWDLLAAPLAWVNLGHTVVLVPLGVTLSAVLVEIAVLGPQGLRTDGPTALAAGVGLVLAIDAGVTEEALFRGFIYEELKRPMGRWGARVVDMVLFPLVHVPQELGSQTNLQIGAGVAARSGLTVLLDIAYDEGGLPESVTLHALYDAVVEVGAAIAGQTASSAGLRSLSDPIAVGLMPASGAGRHSPLSTPVVIPLFSTSF